MSNNNNNQFPQEYFIDKFNFSRRVVDHRRPHDLNHAENRPVFNSLWYKALKQRSITKYVRDLPLFSSMYLPFILGLIVIGDSYYREYFNDGSQPVSRLTEPNVFWGPKYVLHRGNEDSDLGRWNTVFYCWEKEKNCGRDFD